MKRTMLVLLAALICVPVLQGCAGAVVAGGATAVALAHDRRTAGSVVEDQNIEFKAFLAKSKDDALMEQSNINVTSFNQVVLLTGETPSSALRNRMEKLARDIPQVRTVHNEIVVARPSNLSSRGNDVWLVSKIKANLFKVKQPDFDPTRIKVIAENGAVFLMGLVTRAEADAAVELVRQMRGVQRVVKVFEYIG